MAAIVFASCPFSGIGGTAGGWAGDVFLSFREAKPRCGPAWLDFGSGGERDFKVIMMMVIILCFSFLGGSICRRVLTFGKAECRQELRSS